jgi:hypothetical protein
LLFVTGVIRWMQKRTAKNRVHARAYASES